MSEPTPTSTDHRGTTRLLLCGVVAGPAFLLTWLMQALTRDGFDPVRHPISLLSLGTGGWIQVANFIVAGGLVMAAAGGMRRVMRSGAGRTWGPFLVAGFGAGLLIAGLFRTDAGAGFPAGAPLGAPEMSWHGLLHEVGFGLASVCWIAACLVFARRFAVLHQRRWVAVCLGSLGLTLLIMAWPHLDSLSLRLVLGTAVEFGFVAVLSIQLLQVVGTVAPVDRTGAAGEPADAATGGNV